MQINGLLEAFEETALKFDKIEYQNVDECLRVKGVLEFFCGFLVEACLNEEKQILQEQLIRIHGQMKQEIFRSVLGGYIIYLKTFHR